jgi:hypothetical protein
MSMTTHPTDAITGMKLARIGAGRGSGNRKVGDFRT